MVIETGFSDVDVFAAMYVNAYANAVSTNGFRVDGFDVVLFHVSHDLTRCEWNTPRQLRNSYTTVFGGLMIAIYPFCLLELWTSNDNLLYLNAT